MPDLNLANPDVRAETERVARFWVDSMKVDGFRLDAVAHFFEESDGQWKHAAAVYPWLRDYAAAVRRMRPGLFTIGEVYDDLDAVKKYYPDQLDSYFMFEVADAVIDGVRSGAKQPIIDAVQRVAAEIPSGRGATFLRNHDQTRTMTEFAGDIARAKLAATLLFTLPGIPFVYYGEEIGMTGAKPAGDPRLRTPMQWTRSPAAGLTSALPWEPLQPDSFTANVAAQTDDASSLLNLYRALIRVRTARPELAAGPFVPLTSSEGSALAFVRPLGGRALVVIANLGDTPIASLRLSSTNGALPPGRYRATVIAGEGSVADVRVGRDGRVDGWTPVRTVGPLRSFVIELDAR
jgi:glycosidase